MARIFAVSAFFLSVSLAAGETPVNFAKPAPNKPDEPLARAVALDKTAAFLDGVSVTWTRERKCGTCHTNYPYLLARPLLQDVLKEEKSAGFDEVRGFFEKRVSNWDRGEKGDAPRWPAEVVATAATLAMCDARTGKLQPLTRQALDRMWTLQDPDGGFKWIKCNWPPMEHDDYFGAVYTAIGVGLAPEGYAQTEKARAGLEKLRGWLKKNPPADLHHKAMLLWASCRVDGLLIASEKKETIEQLRAVQGPDGGWSLTALARWERRNKHPWALAVGLGALHHWHRLDGTPDDHKDASDGYGTGFVVFVLRQAGVPAGDAQIQQGIHWLQTHQRESGRWFTRSLNTDRFHFITNAGTSFAVLALDACDALKP